MFSTKSRKTLELAVASIEKLIENQYSVQKLKEVKLKSFKVLSFSSTYWRVFCSKKNFTDKSFQIELFV